MNENELRLIRMADVELQKVEWLWFPFIPFGKISMIQGDPGEGKTTLALRLAAACSQGKPLPNTPEQERVPINVIYQTAEDGLGDTIKPRLMDAHADENRIFCIDESALLHSSFVFQNHKTGCHVAKVFQMKSVTLQVVLKEGCRVCILLLSAFALLHSSFSARCHAL